MSEAVVTIRDIARVSGVSYSTVSRALSGEGGRVKESTRGKVLETAQRLGYVVNRQARSLAGGKNQVVGLLVHALDNDYFGQLLRGIDEALAQSDFEIMLFTTHRHKNKEVRHVTRMMGGVTDGLLIVSPEALPKYVQSLQEKAVPYVLVDSAGEGTSVSSTNVQGAYDATRHLLDLGHRRIGHVAGSRDLHVAASRLEGYRRALASRGVPFDPGLVRDGTFTQDGGRRAATELLSLGARPSAIFAANDASAFGVIGAADALGLEVPRDLSVVGFDDLPISEYAKPKLTTVRQPIREIGEVAARLLLEQFRGQPTASVELPTELLIRASCAAPQPTTAKV